MNYIKEVNQFNVWLHFHPRVSSSARLLWYSLMHYNNSCGWKKKFTVPISSLMMSSGLSASAIKRARATLQKAGRIRYIPQPDNRATVYEMISMEEENLITSWIGKNNL